MLLLSDLLDSGFVLSLTMLCGLPGTELGLLLDLAYSCSSMYDPGQATDHVLAVHPCWPWLASWPCLWSWWIPAPASNWTACQLPHCAFKVQLLGAILQTANHGPLLMCLHHCRLQCRYHGYLLPGYRHPCYFVPCTNVSMTKGPEPQEEPFLSFQAPTKVRDSLVPLIVILYISKIVTSHEIHFFYFIFYFTLIAI